MPIILTNYNFKELCWGNKWEVESEDLLVTLVANVLVGYQHHVAKILHGVGIQASLSLGQHAINDAISKLTLAEGEDPYHRDGLIFQIFSWIAAHKCAGKNSLILKPHLIPAQKGFDGLQVKINSETSEVEAVVIFEDKATSTPRHTVKSKVWREFKQFEAGERESELMQETIGLITQRPDLIPNIDDAINKLIWKKVRSYRVAITVEPDDLDEKGIRALFKDYDKIIPHDSNIKRQGEVIHLPNLREWLEEFSKKVIAHLNSLGSKNV